MNIQIIIEPITLSHVQDAAQTQFGDMIKAVVDLDQKMMALGGDLHADAEAMLLEQGSIQENLWGINLYPDQFGTDDFIEFDSMINIRPRQGNRSRSVESPSIQQKIRELVAVLVIHD